MDACPQVQYCLTIQNSIETLLGKQSMSCRHVSHKKKFRKMIEEISSTLLSIQLTECKFELCLFICIVVR